jgi:hypothetical protein
VKRTSRILIALLTLGIAVIVAIPAAAYATFKSTPSAALSVTTATLLPPPTKPTVTCDRFGDTTVTWPITPSTRADGYVVFGKSGTVEQSVAVSGRSSLSYKYPGSVPSGTTITVTATVGGTAWTSARSAATTTTVNCG